MRIVQVANFVHDTSGGVRVAIDAIGAGYAKAGHDVMTLRPGARHHLHRDELGRTVVELPGVPLPSSGGYRLLVRRAPVARLVASWRPDVVEVHDTTTLAWLGAHAGTLGATAVLFAHERLDLVLGDHVGAPALMRRAATWHQRRTSGGFDVACAPSRFAAAALGVDVDVHVVPLGVDLDAFHASRRAGIVRQAWPRRVLLVSRLTREKQPTLAVGAVEELRWRGWDVELVVAGDGPLRAAMVGTGVRLLGHIGDRRHLAALVADADVVVCPGPRETFCLAALEALASGTPVVCVDAGALPELVVAGAGVACAATPVALADGLASTLSGDREAQRSAARRRAESFTWDRTVARLLAVYRTATSTTAAPFRRS